MTSYIGNIPVPQATQTRDRFTATAGQTSFATAGYTPGFLDVFLNGVHLVNGTDYTATNGSDVVLTSGAAAGDVLEVLSFGTFQTGDFVPTSGGTFTGGVTVPSLTSTGAMTGTNLTLSGGVYLGGTGSANLLDDYEEGTFTATLDFQASSTGSLSYTYNTFRYIKIGDMVFISGYFLWGANNFSASSGALRLKGLPFAAASAQSYRGGLGITYSSSPWTGITSYSQAFRTETGEPEMTFNYMSSPTGDMGATINSYTNLDSTGEIMITGSYPIA